MEIWIEKEALAGVVVEVTDPIDVPLCTTRGYPSLSYLCDAAETIRQRSARTVIYYMGDHDPSGVDIPRATEARLREFAPEADLGFTRIAVTPDQIRAMNLATRPTKQTDSRLKAFGDGGSVELDAIPPRTLRDIVREAIEDHIDHDRKEQLEMVEREEREVLRYFTREICAGRGPGGPRAR